MVIEEYYLLNQWILCGSQYGRLEMDTLKRALMPALLDLLSIFIASILGAIIIMLTFSYEHFSGYVAYLIATIFVALGVFLSKKLRSKTVAHVVNLFVVSLVCISVTFNAAQILAGFIARHVSWDMSEGVEGFISKYALPGSEGELLVWTLITTFALVIANRWGNEFFKGEAVPKKDVSSLEALCFFILWITSFPVNLVLVSVFLMISLISAYLCDDVALFAAAGGPITIIGLLSTVKFTTIEKYLKRDELIANSTGLTGPPVSEADVEAIVARNREAARKRLTLELRSELTGIALTVFGTSLWAYGAYLPIFTWLKTISRFCS